MSDITTTTRFCGLLTIVFIVLKLTNVITWSWFWVLSPLLISFAVVILFLLLLVLAVRFGMRHV